MAETGITVEFDATRAVTALQQQPKRTLRAVGRALNRAIVSARAAMASLIAKDMGLKVGDAKAAITLQQATPAKRMKSSAIWPPRFAPAQPPWTKQLAGARPCSGARRQVRLPGWRSRAPSRFRARAAETSNWRDA